MRQQGDGLKGFDHGAGDQPGLVGSRELLHDLAVIGHNGCRHVVGGFTHARGAVAMAPPCPNPNGRRGGVGIDVYSI
ncbi:MAG: hypothetical protein R2857_05650 [Vampirovibrionales bacterium]